VSRLALGKTGPSAIRVLRRLSPEFPRNPAVFPDPSRGKLVRNVRPRESIPHIVVNAVISLSL